MERFFGKGPEKGKKKRKTIVLFLLITVAFICSRHLGYWRLEWSFASDLKLRTILLVLKKKNLILAGQKLNTKEK